MPISQVKLSSATLRVRTAGDAGPRVVFAVDPPNVLEHYGPLFARLKPHARLLAFEAPGFGQSKARGHSHTLDASARVIIELLESFGGEPSVLAFPCVAAYAALRVAAQRPDLVSGLVLIQAPSWPDMEAWVDRVDRKRVLRTPVVGSVVMALRAEQVAAKWYAAAAGSPERARSLAAFGVESLTHGARFPLAAAFQGIFNHGAPTFASVACPTLLVWGSADRTHRKSDPSGLRAVVPAADEVRFEASGHFPELEEPAAFADALAEWLRGKGLTTTSR